MNEEEITSIVDEWLEEDDFETFLEEFDITPAEAFLALYHTGLIDDTILESYKKVR